MKAKNFPYGTWILLTIVVLAGYYLTLGLDILWKIVSIIPLFIILYIIFKKPQIGNKIEQPFKNRSKWFFVLLYAVILFIICIIALWFTITFKINWFGY